MKKLLCACALFMVFAPAFADATCLACPTVTEEPVCQTYPAFCAEYGEDVVTGELKCRGESEIGIYTLRWKEEGKSPQESYAQVSCLCGMKKALKPSDAKIKEIINSIYFGGQEQKFQTRKENGVWALLNSQNAYYNECMQPVRALRDSRLSVKEQEKRAKRQAEKAAWVPLK